MPGGGYEVDADRGAEEELGHGGRECVSGVCARGMRCGNAGQGHNEGESGRVRDWGKVLLIVVTINLNLICTLRISPSHALMCTLVVTLMQSLPLTLTGQGLTRG